MRTWNFPDVHPAGPGPWADEPDKAQWVDDTTNLDCLIVRAGTSGSLCGYVGVPPGHPWHDLHPDELPDIHAHGEINFASLCQEGAEDGPGVCHIPEPGRPERVWWLGFDCSHAGDETPNLDTFLVKQGIRPPGQDPGLFQNVYRPFDYVADVVRCLALQAAAAAPVSQPAAQL